MAEQSFQLERLYIALNSAQGQAPSLQLLARTPGIRPEQITECWRLAQLMPPPPDQRNEAMPGALGIFRGETADYILVKAQPGQAGTPQFQYVMMPSAALRAMGGNLRLFEGFAREPLPTFTFQRTDLPPFVLDHLEAADSDTQTNDLLALIDYCKGNLKIVNGLLSGLVQAMGLAIINAPLSLHDRLSFVQSILTLLPIPARMAITFATSVIDPAQTNTQIKFMASDIRPNRHVVYDWAAGKLLTDPPDDVYTKFIMAQLRLDASLVLEQTEKLARTSVWRAMRKDDMANALAWASRRASLDSVVLDGQPADKTMVAAVLREDPTLPDDVRLAYTRHLIKFSLALDDPNHTEIVPIMAISNAELSNVAFEELRDAISNGHADAVYHLIERWLTQPPPGTDVSRWQPLLGMAAVAQNNALLTEEPEKLVAFLEKFLATPPTLGLESIVPQLIGISRKRGYENPDVARIVFLLAVHYLPAVGLQRLIAEVPFTKQLPPPLRDAFPHLTEQPTAAPAQLIAKAAQTFGSEYESVIMGRLIEWALYLRRFDLLDSAALRGLVQLGASSQGPRFAQLAQHVVEAMSPAEVVARLEPTVPALMVQIDMAFGWYPEGIRLLEVYQKALYSHLNTQQFGQLLKELYRDLPLGTEGTLRALAAMQNSQINVVNRAAAMLGAMEGKQWSAEMAPAGKAVADVLSKDPRLVELLSVDSILKLLKSTADRQDGPEALRLANVLVSYALMLAPDRGPTLMQLVYPLLNWSPDVQDAAIEVLRTYVRRAPAELARELPNILGSKLGDSVRRSLDASNRLRLLLNGGDFVAFAEQISIATHLFRDLAVTYGPKRDLPQIFHLRRTMEGMPGGLSDAERERVSRNLDLIGQNIIILNTIASQRKARGNPEAVRDQLVRGEIAPLTGVDALTWIGGHIAEGRAFDVEQEIEAPPHLFGSRSVNMLLRESDLIVRLLEGLILAFPEKDSGSLDPAMWRGEVDAVWAMLSLYNQRQITQTMQEDTQHLAQWIRILGDKANDKIFQPGGYGKQLHTGRAQPKLALEALHWVSGYFAKQHG